MNMEAKLIGTLVCSIALLTSCTYNPFIGDNHTTGSPAGAVIGAAAGAGGVALFTSYKPLMVAAGIGGGMIGYYVTTLRYDAGGVMQGGGQVYKVGDYVGIEIPTDKLFEPNTAEFLPQAAPILDSAANVLQRTPNNNIVISGNTSGFSMARWEQKLSEDRAEKVAAYLWNAGVNNFKETSNNTRRLNYVGYGNYFPIATNLTNDGIRANSRIQITSYPSSCDLQLGKRDVAMRNVGAFKDEDTSSASNCGSKDC